VDDAGAIDRVGGQEVLDVLHRLQIMMLFYCGTGLALKVEDGASVAPW
jgi:hypothetical protein